MLMHILQGHDNLQDSICFNSTTGFLATFSNYPLLSSTVLLAWSTAFTSPLVVVRLVVVVILIIVVLVVLFKPLVGKLLLPNEMSN